MTKLWGQACHAEGPPPHTHTPVRPGLLCTGAPVCGLLGSGQGTGQGHPAGRDGGRGGGGACTLLLYMVSPAGLPPHCGGRPTSRPGLGCFVRWAVASPLSQVQPQLHLLQEACGPSQAGGSVLRPHSPSDDQVALT